MNNLTKALLGSAAMTVLATAPAMAAHSHPAFSVTAMHDGKVVNKTKMHNQKAGHITYTFSVYATIPSELNQWVPLTSTFYKWNSYSTLCSNPKQKVKFDPKKTQYGKLRAATETYSEGCPSGPTTFFGAEYKLLKSTNQDQFVVELIGTFKNSNGKYKGQLNIDTNLSIE
jgi:hypothetical protein